MKKATFVVTNDYIGNKAFDMSDSRLNRDNCLYINYLLREKFAEQGWDLATQDINPIDKSDLVLYWDMPDVLPRLEDIDKSVLFLWESEIIKPNNYDIAKHERFRTIFTWRTDLLGHRRYYRIYHAQKLDPTFTPEVLPSRYIALIAANKKSRDPRELYSSREKVIDWYEKNAPEAFDLYGIGWDRLSSSNRWINAALRRCPALARALSSRHPSYKGGIVSKKEILSNYKFTIAFENARSVPGYVTEKIIDPLLVGSIPVYLGADDVQDIIPGDCFIDARDYPSIDCMCSALLDIKEDEIIRRRRAIRDFFKSPKSRCFDVVEFTQTVVEVILGQRRRLS